MFKLKNKKVDEFDVHKEIFEVLKSQLNLIKNQDKMLSDIAQIVCDHQKAINALEAQVRLLQEDFSQEES